jgi:hypothetical protein
VSFLLKLFGFLPKRGRETILEGGSDEPDGKSRKDEFTDEDPAPVSGSERTVDYGIYFDSGDRGDDR